MFHVHGPVGWEGPWAANQIRAWVATIAPARPVWSQATRQIRADLVAPQPSVDLGRLVFGALGVGVMAWPGYEIWKDITEDPETRAIHEEAEYHLATGALVSADLPGWPRPPNLGPGRSIPDVHAEYATRTIEFENENENENENEKSVQRSHAVKQHADFSTWASRSPRRRYRQEVIAGGRGGRG